MPPPSSPTAAAVAEISATLPDIRTRGVWILLSFLLGACVLFVLGSFLFDEPRGRDGAIFGTLLFLFAMGLLKSGRPRAATHLALTGVSVIGFGLSIVGPGVYSTGAMQFLVLPVLGGLFGDKQGAVVWSVVSFGALVALAILHETGGIDHAVQGLPAPLPRARTLILFNCVSIGATTGFLHLQGRLHNALMRSIVTLRTENLERQRAEREALQAADTRARFLATMSHELRTPLNGVVCAARLLEDAPDPAQRQRLSETLVHSAEGLVALINNVLDWSRLQHGGVELHTEPTDLRQLLQQTTAGLTLLAEQRGLRVHTRVGATVPAYIAGDAARLRQVLTNLLGNAVKFTESGSVRVELDHSDGQLLMEVHDTGVGMDLSAEGSREALFAPFAQADSTVGRRFEGSGLGLAITRELVEAMGGRIDVRSTPGEGSTFSVALPCEELEAPELDEPATEEIQLARRTAHLKILIVEDNPVNLELQTLLLQKLGHTVEGVESGSAAVETVLGTRFDLVLMDCQMPIMDGLMATRLIRRGPPEAAAQWVVGLSADARPEARQEALEAGMDGYLTKPLRLQDFLATLQQREATGLLGR